MEQEEEQFIRKSEPQSMVSFTVGRVMGTLLNSRPKKLQDSVARLSSDSQRVCPGSLDESLWFLHKYVRDAAEREESLDEILVPMIEHTLRSKESKHGGQAMMLLNWLFQDEFLFEAIARNLKDIIVRKDDRYIALGWCTLVRGLAEYENTIDEHLVNGIREKHVSLLKILSSCISHLSSIVLKGSTLQGGFEFPSRLAVSAADCLLALTGGLTKSTEIPTKRPKSASPSASVRPVALVPLNNSEKKVSLIQKYSEVLNAEKANLLWDHLLEIIFLVQSLLAWSKKSRPLHAKGLEQVLKWLQEIKKHYGDSQDEAGSMILKTRTLLLSSCWRHYFVLLHLEDPKFPRHIKELLDQYLSGIQYYTENHAEGNPENKSSGMETRKFFLNCLCLLLGRLDSKRFESIALDYGMQLVHVLLSQLHCDDEDVIDGVVCIFKAVIFRPNYSSEGSLSNTRQMDAVLPMLLHLLDKRDGTARAAVKLIAEYCSRSTDDHCVKEVLKHLASRNVLHRRNAIDVISELIHLSTDSVNSLSQMAWQEIGNHLLECLEDEETVICVRASNLLPMIDPSLVLPALINHIYTLDEKVQSCADDALVGLLRCHNENSDIICLLLDCLSNLSQSPDMSKITGYTGEGSKFVSDRVFKLIPEWCKSVQNWNSLIGSLIDKMFAEPSNAIIVRFLSCINEQLADSEEIVLSHVLLRMKEQKEFDESLLSGLEYKTHTSVDSQKMQQSLFERLCPLLILRLLPLRVFSDLDSYIMYGQLSNQGMVNDCRVTNPIDHECVAAVLLNRAFSKFEFEDVRKLAAELCGRIHPQVLFPVVCSYLKQFTSSQDILKIKACLFSICTSLVIRGKDSIMHPAIHDIRRTLEKILLWPSLDGNEVSKAQHGCIDCLALMICAELQAPGYFKGSTSRKINIVGKNPNYGEAASRNSVLPHVLDHLIHDKSELVPTSKSGIEYPAAAMPIHLSFRLCMANILISACQKMLDSGKKRFAKRTLRCLIDSTEVIAHAEVRAACIQVLFSAVYHLKSAILPYSSDLLKLALKFLGKGSEKERMASAKLMACLMGSEDVIVESISGGLVEARSVLSAISSSDPSPAIRDVCKKLLVCITSS